MPQMFGTITSATAIFDGHRRHEVFAGLARGDRRFDRDRVVTARAWRRGLVGGCDKNMPGAMIAIARMNIRRFSFMAAPSSRSL